MARKTGVLNTFIKIVKEAEKAEKRRINEIEKVYRAQKRLEERREKEIKYENKRIEKEKMLLEKENAIKYAAKMTKEAEEERVKITSILKEAVNKSVELNWNDYFETKEFESFKFLKPIMPSIEEMPKKENYMRKITFIDKLFKFLKNKKIEEDEINYKESLIKWEIKSERIKDEYENAEKNYKLQLEKWNLEKNKFEEDKVKINIIIQKQKEMFENKEKEGVEFYFSEIIENTEYPEYFTRNFDIEYSEENRILIIDYNLPIKKDIPNLKTMKYVITRKEFSEVEMKEKEIDEIYDSALYQLALRTNYEIYKSDYIDSVKSIVFNGWIDDINKATGKSEIKCILSIQTTKEEYMNINLMNVEPKLCFQKFKGISSSKLSDLIPIAPIIKVNSTDSRFIDSYDVAYNIEGTNLAAMNWEDFEHLIRELFEKEFANNGSEVKITQSSRDGGVDAVIFDPDPIRGGKFVIQAKRYTNVVGVSAVRDLYGTLMNEGASKGILVTTANFGSDSYEFAKDKPITLINGNNLLYMLSKHGYNARIDLIEAKKMLNN